MKIHNFIAISLVALVLSSCGTTKSFLRQISPGDEVAVSESQFFCGPRAANLPEDEALKGWSDSQILDWGVESWLWGERCALTNEYNKNYFMCALAKNKAACDRVKTLKIEVDKTNGITNN